MVGFIALILRVSQQADPVREAEEVEEEENGCASEGWALLHARDDQWKRIKLEVE